MTTVALHHQAHGSPTAPAVLLGGSLGSTHRMWDELAADLARDHHVVALDLRGHGDSPAAASPVDVADLAADVVALADRLGLERFAYVGISLGGAVGLSLALDHADRLTSLVAACTAAWFGGPEAWQQRAAQVRAEGVGALREGNGERWFTNAVRPTPRAQQVLDALAAQHPESYAACCEAIGAFDVRDRLGEITVPTTIIGADDDPVSPPETIAALGAIPGSTTRVIEGSRHLANLNRPEEFAAAVRSGL